MPSDAILRILKILLIRDIFDRKIYAKVLVEMIADVRVPQRVSLLRRGVVRNVFAIYRSGFALIAHAGAQSNLTIFAERNFIVRIELKQMLRNVAFSVCAFAIIDRRGGSFRL